MEIEMYFQLKYQYLHVFVSLTLFFCLISNRVSKFDSEICGISFELGIGTVALLKNGEVGAGVLIVCMPAYFNHHHRHHHHCHLHNFELLIQFHQLWTFDIENSEIRRCILASPLIGVNLELKY
jgi:hypothetical protein